MNHIGYARENLFSFHSQVFLFAIIFSVIIKNPGGDDDVDDDEEECKIETKDNEMLHQQDEGAFPYLRDFFFHT